MNKLGRTRQVLLYMFVVVCLVTYWALVLSSCSMSKAFKTEPAKQQSPITSQAIPVDQVDLDGDGHISISEQHNLTSHTPGVLPVFLCIAGATVCVTGLCAWWCRRSREEPHEESHDHTTSDTLIQETQHTPPPTHTSDDDDWLDSEQDFDGIQRR